MKLGSIVFGVLIFSAVILSFSLSFFEQADTYGVDYNTSQFESYEKIDETLNITNDVTENIRGTEGGGTDFNFVTQSFGALKITFNSFSIVTDIINLVGSELGVPSYWVTIGFTVLILSFVFLIIASILSIRSY